MNVFLFCGRAVRDPEIRYTQGQKPMALANFTLAVSRDFKRDGEPDADFFNCTAFGKNAESIEKYVNKGSKLICTAHVQNDNYEKDGIKHYGVKIIIDKWEFAESKKAAAEYAEQEQEKPKQQSDDFMPIPSNLDLDMPFA